MLCWRDCLDDDQPPTATRTRQCQDTGKLIGIAEAVIVAVILVWRFGPEQEPDPGDIGGPMAISEEAVVADAMLPLGQDMDQEPTNELIRLERHDFVPPGAVDAVIFDAEGDALIVHSDQSAVGDGDAVRVARQICQHGFWSGERFFGVNHPVDFAQRFDECVEGIPVQQVSIIAVELQLPGFVQLGQPFQNKAPVKAGQDPNREEEVPTAGDPTGAIDGQATARNDHVDMRVMRHR